MLRVEPNLRLETLQVVGAVAAFVLLALPRSRAHRADDDVAQTQALELRAEEESGARVVRLQLPIVVGRAPDSSLVVRDARVSRMHARFDMIDGVLFLRDLGSRNGTLLNARPIDVPVPVHEGDEIDVGDVRIVVGKVGVWT
jgi:pSer/pThr/pTyr-binding forkhead associated (FHA) protein